MTERRTVTQTTEVDAGVELQCPNCAHHLPSPPLRCPHCAAEYPVVDGIPILLSRDDFARYRESRQTVQEYYRGVATRYDRTHHVGMPGAQQFLREYDGRIRETVSRPTSLLEVGAGTGFATQVVSRYAKQLVVTDASLEMLAINRAQNPTITAYCCAIENLPFEEQSFGAIVGNNTFYLVPDKRKAAQSIARVLSNGGELIFSEMNPFNLLWPVSFTANRRWFERTIYQMFPRHMRSYFEPHGLKLVEWSTYSYDPYFGGKKILTVAHAIGRTLGSFGLGRLFTGIRIWYRFVKQT